MKKRYLLTLCLCLMAITGSFAQVNAADDAPLPANIIGTTWLFNADGSYFSVLQNDTNNGLAITPQTATISITSGANPFISVNAVTGQVFVNADLPPGTYTLTYQVCMNAGGSCDTATLVISTCLQSAPTASLVAQTCTSPPVAMLGNLPSGNWTLVVDPYPYWTTDGVYTVSGNGNTFDLNLDPETYQYHIRVLSDSGCLSPYVEVTIPYMQLISAVTTPEYLDLDNNGIVNPGDLILCQISMTNLSECELTNVMGQNGVIQFPTVDIPAGQTVMVSGTYVITPQDVLNGTVSDWEAITGTSPLGNVYAKAFFTLELPIPTGFHLYAFADMNGNLVQDAGEPLVPYGIFVYEPNNSGNPVNVQSYSGEFNLFETNAATTYDFHYVPAEQCGNGFVSTMTYDNLSLDPNGFSQIGFPLNPSNCTDLGIWVYGNNPVPGLESYSYIIVRNESLLPQSTVVTYSNDPTVSVNSVITSGIYSISPLSTTINLTIPALSSEIIWIYYTTPPIPTVSLGQQLTFYASLVPPGNDYDATNNSASYIKAVSGGYDPNSKSETHGSEILFSSFAADDKLNYIINFENTGNGNAINVSLTDNLDAMIDETSVRLIGSTHEPVLFQQGSNLEFRFDNINLPPSTDVLSQTGKGSVSFSVKLKPGYGIGDIVPNQASIFFDTNPAIITNTVETEFVAVMSVADHNAQSLRIYPNPAQDLLNVSGSDIKSIEIVDVSGKVILTKNVDATQAEIGVSQLSNGIYFAKITTNNSVRTIRFVKQ